MADVNYITDKNGNKVNIADLTARTNASTALLESEYNRQLADNVYAGRDISTITALASEIASAGSIPAFLNAARSRKASTGCASATGLISSFRVA